MKTSVFALISAVTLAACAHQPTQELAGYGNLEQQIRANYAKTAMERNGLCIRPQIGIINRTEVVEETDTTLVVKVRHTIRGDNIEYSPEDRVALRTGCPVFGERTFTFAKAGDSFDYQSMTGPLRPTVRYNFNQNG